MINEDEVKKQMVDYIIKSTLSGELIWYPIKSFSSTYCFEAKIDETTKAQIDLKLNSLNSGICRTTAMYNKAIVVKNPKFVSEQVNLFGQNYPSEIYQVSDYIFNNQLKKNVTQLDSDGYILDSIFNNLNTAGKRDMKLNQILGPEPILVNDKRNLKKENTSIYVPKSNELKDIGSKAMSIKISKDDKKLIEIKLGTFFIYIILISIITFGIFYLINLLLS